MMDINNRTPPRAKLDNYNYELVFSSDGLVAVIVYVDGPTDVKIADISTEINVSQNRIYVEGYKVLSHSIDLDETSSRLIISTKEENQEGYDE